MTSDHGNLTAALNSDCAAKHTQLVESELSGYNSKSAQECDLHNNNANYTSTDVNKNISVSPSSDVLDEQRILIFSQLNQQRLENSSYCDLFLKTGNGNTVESFSAHSSVLAALIGKKFKDKIELIFRKENELRRPSSTQSDISRGEKVEIFVPPGFHSFINYCYTTSFLPLPSSATYKKDVASVIERMVDNCKLKDQMLKKLTEESQSHDAKPLTKVILDWDVERNDQHDCHAELSEDCDDLVESDSDTNFECTVDVNQNSPPKTRKARNLTSLQCEICEDTFPFRAQLVKHLRNEHFQDQPKRSRGRPLRRTAMSKISASNAKVNVILSRSSKGKPHLKSRSIGECCGETFMNRLALGIHVLQQHATPWASCSECKILMPFANLIEHYQSEHNFRHYPSDPDKLSQDALHEIEVVPKPDDTLTLSLSVSQANELTCQYLNKKDSVNMEDGSINLDDYNCSAELDETNGIPFDTVTSSAMKEIMFEPDTKMNDVNLWLNETTCVACQSKMSIFKYVEHLKEQQEKALNEVGSKPFDLHKIHRCLLYQCDLCHSEPDTVEKPVRLYLLLSLHISRYHLNDSSKDEKVSCNICGAVLLKFYIHKHLKDHQRKKAGIKAMKTPCDICGKEVNKKRISVHRRTHFERYPCAHCSKIFNRKENLIVHSRIHTGEKPFVCEICGNGFRQNVELRLHTRKHEKEKRQLNFSNEKVDATVATVQQQVFQIAGPSKITDHNLNQRPVFDTVMAVQWQYNPKAD